MKLTRKEARELLEIERKNAKLGLESGGMENGG